MGLQTAHNTNAVWPQPEGVKLIIEKWFVIFPEFKVLLQRLYHHPDNNNDRLCKDILTYPNLAVVKDLMIWASTKLETFLYLHEIL